MNHYSRSLDKQKLFKDHFGLTDDNLMELWNLFMEYGMTRGEGKDRTKGNHYFLQGIVQYGSIEFKSWGKKLSKPVLDVIQSKYPQLMVQDKQFER